MNNALFEIVKDRAGTVGLELNENGSLWADGQELVKPIALSDAAWFILGVEFEQKRPVGGFEKA